MSGKQEAQDWAETVRTLRRAPRAHLRAGRGDQPQGRAGGALRGRRQPAHRPARRGLLGLLLRRRRKGGRRPLRQGGGADRAARQGPHAGPGPGRARLQRRVDRGPRGRSPSTSCARSSSSRSTSTGASSRPCRSEYDPVALRELFSPGFLEWTTTMTGEIDFGINDRQLWFLWRLRRAQRGRAEGGAEERRAAVQTPAGRDGRERHPHLPARPLARRPGAVSRRLAGLGGRGERLARAPSAAASRLFALDQIAHSPQGSSSTPSASPRARRSRWQLRGRRTGRAAASS